MEIKLNREKIRKRSTFEIYGGLSIGYVIVGFICFILAMITDLSGYSYAEIHLMSWTIFIGVSIIYFIFIFLVSIIWAVLYSQSLNYTIEKDKLIEEYEVIVKKRKERKFQAISGVDISQGIIDRLFNIFYIGIRTGFGDNTRTYYIKYLSEKQAMQIANIIKVDDKNIQKVRIV